MNNNPLTPDEFEKLLKTLELISTNIQRLLNQGVVVLDESLDDEKIKSSTSKIDSYRQKIERERQRLKRVKDYLRRRREQDQRRKQHSSEHKTK